MFEIIPSPGTENKGWAQIEEKIAFVRPFAKTIHIDVVDGKFAPHKTFADPAPFAKYTKELAFEVHFMVENPLQYLKSWADAGFRRFIGQVEKMPDQAEFVAAAQLLGEAVLAIDKQTPATGITVPLDDLDGLLVMTIQAGKSGQLFDEALIQKVKELSEKTTVPITVDGGVNDETILVAAANGAKRFVATSFLFDMEGFAPEQQYKLLKKKLDELKIS